MSEGSVSKPFFHGGTPEIIFLVLRNPLPMKTHTGEKMRQLVAHGGYSIIARQKFCNNWNFLLYFKIKYFFMISQRTLNDVLQNTGRGTQCLGDVWPTGYITTGQIYI